MNTKHRHRRLDLFTVLLIVVALGMTATLAYQIHVYYGDNQVPIAKQSPGSSIIGG